MIFKDLQKLVQHSQQQGQQNTLFERLQNKPFWIWNIEEHRQEDVRTDGDCCFNHIIGLPQKDGIDKPLYDYEEIIFDSLVSSPFQSPYDTQNGNANPNHDPNPSNKKHLWIKKATGLGISEFMLRFMAWLCLKNNALSGSQMCIVTGPRIDLAIALIDRMKRLFVPHGGSSSSNTSSSNRSLAAITFDTKETVIELNNVKIEAFPSHHLDAMRGLPNVSFILLDEADFFSLGQQQQDARDTYKRCI